MATVKSPKDSIAQFETGKYNINDFDPERPRTIYYVTQAPNSESLYSYKLDGDSLSAATYVGEAKKATAAAVFVKDKQCIIFSVNGDGVLQDHQINKQYKWEKGGIDSLGVHPRQDAAFTAIYGIGKVRLYIQDDTGMLHELVLDESSKQWQRSATLQGTKAAGGEGISAVGSEGEVAVFYAHEDFSIHQALFKGGHWTDTEVSATKEGTSPPILVTGYSPNTGVYTLQYTNAEDEVYEVHDGKRTQIGAIGKDETYQPKTAAQCGGRIYIPRRRCCCRCRRIIIICCCY